jgi:CRP/FNR family transcriptional regulator
MTLDESFKTLLLARYPALRTLPAEELGRVLAEGMLRKVPAGTVMFDEAQPCMGFPFVLEGEVTVSKSSEGGREITLYSVGAGDSCVLTSSCLIGDVAYDARGVVQRDATLFVLPRATFERLLASSTAFRRYVFGLFAERMSDLMQTVEAVAFKRMDQRLAALLVQRGPQVNATHQQLADELGSVREIVSRLVRGFATQGLVRTGREQIEVLDPAGLRRVAGLPAAESNGARSRPL